MTKKNNRKPLLLWGGATVSVLALTGGSVAYALDSDSSSAKAELCATVLEGTGTRTTNVVASDSGEYMAAAGESEFVRWQNDKPTVLEGFTADLTAIGVNSEGTVVAADYNNYKAFVHTGEEALELQPPEGVVGNVTVSDISDSGTIVGSVRPDDEDAAEIPVKWEDPAAPAEPLATPEGASGGAAAITADDTIVGNLVVPNGDKKDRVGWYWGEEGDGEFESFPAAKYYPEIEDANGDWAVTSSNIDDEGTQYYHLVPITGSDEPVEIALTDDAENASQIRVDDSGRAYGNNNKGEPVMVADGDVTKLPEVDGVSTTSITDTSADGSVLAGISDQSEEERQPTVWRDCE